MRKSKHKGDKDKEKENESLDDFIKRTCSRHPGRKEITDAERIWYKSDLKRIPNLAFYLSLYNKDLAKDVKIFLDTIPKQERQLQLETKNNRNLIPINIATKNVQIDVVRYLLSIGAKADVATLTYACDKSNPRMVQLLLEHGLNPNDIIGLDLDENGCMIHSSLGYIKSPLLYAVHHENSFGKSIIRARDMLTIVKSLIKYGANVRYVTEHGENVLHDMTPHLVERGKDVCKGTNKILDEVLIILLEAGAIDVINEMDKDGDTPLHNSISDKSYNKLVMLLAAGADVRGFDDEHLMNKTKNLYINDGHLRDKNSRQSVKYLLASGKLINPERFIHFSYTAEEIEGAKAEINYARNKLLKRVKNHIFKVIVALQALELPTLVLLMIIDEYPLSSIFTMHTKWEIIKLIRHFTV